MGHLRDAEVRAGLHRDAVLRIMKNSPMQRWSSRDIRDISGMSIQTVSAALRQLSKDGYVKKIRSQYGAEMTVQYFNEWKLTERALSKFALKTEESKK